MNTLVKSLTTQLEQKQMLVEGIAKDFKHEDTPEGPKFVISTKQYADYRAAVKDAQEIKALLDDAMVSDDTRAFLSNPVGVPAAASGFGKPADPALEGKSLADLFIESKGFQQAKSEGFNSAPYIRADIEGKSIFNFMAGPVPPFQALGRAEQVDMQLQPRRKAHIRDLFPKSSTDAAVLYGIRELGWVNNAAQVKQRYAADGTSAATGADSDVYGKAPVSKLNLTPILIPVVEIAHTIDAHKNILADEKRLRSFINMRMIEGVKYAEDYDLLHSVGDGEKLTGLFNQTGVQVFTGSSADKHDVQIRRAITKALLAEYEPNGIVLSPTMWEAVEVTQDGQGQFRVAVAVAIGAEKMVWRLKVVETTAIEDTKYLVGNFGMAAQLHDRESVSVIVSSENSDNFTRGVVTFRAQERLALEVSRPESLVVGTWTTPA